MRRASQRLREGSRSPSSPSAWAPGTAWGRRSRASTSAPPSRSSTAASLSNWPRRCAARLQPRTLPCLLALPIPFPAQKLLLKREGHTVMWDAGVHAVPYTGLCVDAFVQTSDLLRVSLQMGGPDGVRAAEITSITLSCAKGMKVHAIARVPV